MLKHTMNRLLNGSTLYQSSWMTKKKWDSSPVLLGRLFLVFNIFSDLVNWGALTGTSVTYSKSFWLCKSSWERCFSFIQRSLQNKSSTSWECRQNSNYPSQEDWTALLVIWIRIPRLYGQPADRQNLRTPMPKPPCLNNLISSMSGRNYLA